MIAISIADTTCTRCGRCVDICSENVFSQREKKQMPAVERESFCIACGHCIAVCPSDAIRHTAFPAGSVKDVVPTLMPSAAQLLEALRTRRSIREFQETAVEKNDIEAIIDAARTAPSADNTQSTHYVVVQKKEQLHKISATTAAFTEKTVAQLRNPLIRRIASLAAKDDVDGALPFLDAMDGVARAYKNGDDRILHDAPCIIVFYGKRGVSFSAANATLALQNAALLCHALGLGCFFAGYVVAASERDKKIAQLLDIPDDSAIHGILALGHPRHRYQKWVEKKPADIRWM